MIIYVLQWTPFLESACFADGINWTESMRGDSAAGETHPLTGLTDSFDTLFPALNFKAMNVHVCVALHSILNYDRLLLQIPFLFDIKILTYFSTCWQSDNICAHMIRHHSISRKCSSYTYYQWIHVISYEEIPHLSLCWIFKCCMFASWRAL